MKKLFLGLVLFLTSLLVLNFVKVEAGEVPTYDLTFQVEFGDGVTPRDSGIVNGIGYGQTISIDVASWDNEDFDFLGYVVQGKVAQTIETAQSFRMYENMNIVAHFKPAGTTAVIFMDSNHDLDGVQYTDALGKLTQVPDFAGYSKPGLVAAGWNVADIANHVFTEDTIVYLEYTNNSGQKTLTYDEGTGVETTPFDYNSLVTVNANGSGTFSHWLKDGKVASLNETYKFTMVDDHTVEAVYDDASFVRDSDTLVTVSDIFEVETGYDTIVGQFHLGENEEVVEWGIVESEIPGGITFDTPEVDIFWSTRYNETSQEFMMSFNQTSTDIVNYRGFVTTINTLTDEVKTTYSYYQEMSVLTDFASDLIISEIIEEGGNKAIEIYNGTGQEIDLTPYSVELYSNDNTSPGSTANLTGTLANGDVYVIYNSGSDQAIIDVGDLSNNGVANFNGNDSIVLKNDGVIIDNIGQIGDKGYFSDDATLVRKASITGGDTIADDVFDRSIDWDVYPKNTYSYLGSHTMTLPTTEVSNVYTNTNTPTLITITGDTSVNTNETIQLSSDSQDVFWVSSDPAVLTVDQTGLVTGVAEGTATVTAHSFYNHSVLDEVTITVLASATYDVTFDNDGTTNVVTVDGGDPVTEPTAPTKTGYVFEGWYTSNDGGSTLDTEWNFATGVQDDITLYANWVEISSILDLRTDGTAAYILGIVTGINGSNVYLNDGTAGINIYNYTLSGSVTVGDEILFADNTTSTYHELVQFSFTSYEILSSGNTLPVSVVLNDLSEVTSAYQTQRVSISALEVVSVTGSDLTLTDGTTQVVVYELSSGFLSTAIIGQTANLLNIHVGWYDGLQFNALNDVEVELVPLSDAEKVAGIKAELLADFDGNEYASNSTITLPSTSTVYGGTITWVSSNETLVNSTTGAIGEVATNTSVTLTASIDVNGTTDIQAVSIMVLAAGTLTEQVVYSTGFESDFTPSTSYNNQTELLFGPTGEQWGIIMGTPSTTKPITGTISLQMRSYSGAPLGSAYTSFDIEDITKIVFNAKAVSGTILEVFISKDGGNTWIDGQSYNLTSSSTEYTYNVENNSLSGNFRIKFSINTPSSRTDLTLDDIQIYGMRPE